MLEHYFRKPSTVDRIRAYWLAPQIEHYVEWMHTQNYAAHNILRRVPLLCRFADFAREKGATDLASATSLVDKFASHWVAGANCKNAVTRRSLFDDIRSTVLQMLRLALEGRVKKNRARPHFLLEPEAPGAGHATGLARFLFYAAADVRRLRPAAIFWAIASISFRSPSPALLRHFLSLWRLLDVSLGEILSVPQLPQTVSNDHPRLFSFS